MRCSTKVVSDERHDEDKSSIRMSRCLSHWLNLVRPDDEVFAGVRVTPYASSNMAVSDVIFQRTTFTYLFIMNMGATHVQSNERRYGCLSHVENPFCASRFMSNTNDLLINLTLAKRKWQPRVAIMRLCENLVRRF